MPVTTSKRSAVIRIAGADFEPPDGSLARGSRRDREDYWRQVAKEGFDAVIRQANSGKDIHGNRPRRARPRRDGARGPFFSPHHSLSRVQTQLRHKQRGGVEAVIYWLKPWSIIVGYWAQGVRGRVYDLVGLTVEAQERVKHRAWQWWAAKVSRGRLGQAGVTMVGPAPSKPVMFRQEFGNVLAPRPVYFAAHAPAPVPAVLPAPQLRPRQPAHAVVQAIQPLYEAAGMRRTSLAQIVVAVNRLDATQATGTLIEVAWRLGVTPPPGTRDEALEAIRAVLEDRWRSGVRTPGMGR